MLLSVLIENLAIKVRQYIYVGLNESETIKRYAAVNNVESTFLGTIEDADFAKVDTSSLHLVVASPPCQPWTKMGSMNSSKPGDSLDGLNDPRGLVGKRTCDIVAKLYHENPSLFVVSLARLQRIASSSRFPTYPSDFFGSQRRFRKWWVSGDVHLWRGHIEGAGGRMRIRG